ncbi:MAG: hypothetical protein R2939_07260 [Kofleriaceae bacterium]
MAAAAVACGGGDRSPIAVLAAAAGPVERQAGTSAWAPAKVGARFFLGDAARTGDGDARLTIGTSALRMDPHTLVRFGQKGARQTLDVELGAFELEGAGAFGLGLGELALGERGGVRVTAAAGGGATLELLVGDARFVDEGGTATALAVGQVLDLSLGEVTIVSPDARPALDAAPPDAAPPPSAALTLSISGSKAQIMAPGAKAWAGMPAGDGSLPAGAALKLGARTTAEATQPGLSLSLPAGAELAAGGDPFIALRAGRATLAVDAGATGRIAVPGATVTTAGDGAAGVAIEIAARQTKVTATRGSATLVGRAGRMTLQRGETATVSRDGSVDLLYEIPRYFDLQVRAGESFTVHDPKASTAIQFDLSIACPGGGVVELARGGDWGSARQSGGATTANLMVPGGTWSYRVRCSEGSGEGKAVATGRITVRRDDGRRPLPAKPPTNLVDVDGRDYKIVYQNLIPSVDFRWKGAPGSAFRLTLGTGKRTKVVDAKTSRISVKGSDLADGTYPFYIERTDGQTARSKTSRLIIEFDNAAPAASIEAPRGGAPFGAEVAIKGVALPGWSASVDGTPVPVDRQGRFAATVAAPRANALAIRLAHAQRGVHYYLRRAR